MSTQDTVEAIFMEAVDLMSEEHFKGSANILLQVAEYCSRHMEKAKRPSFQRTVALMSHIYDLLVWRPNERESGFATKGVIKLYTRLTILEKELDDGISMPSLPK